ncbi:hypothetical protein ES703_78933 [subsurface metagenome]
MINKNENRLPSYGGIHHSDTGLMRLPGLGAYSTTAPLGQNDPVGHPIYAGAHVPPCEGNTGQFHRGLRPGGKARVHVRQLWGMPSEDLLDPAAACPKKTGLRCNCSPNYTRLEDTGGYPKD